MDTLPEGGPSVPPDPAARPIAVMLNSAAGALLDQSEAHVSLAAMFAEAGLQPSFVPKDAGDLPQRVAAALAMQPGAVVVAGGDGTIACAAHALAGTGATLGILPFGTMNLLAKDLGLPTDDAAAAVGIVAAGHVREIDVATVNGRTFLCASMLGLPARLGKYREAQRGGGSAVRRWSRFGIAVMRVVRRYIPRRFVLEIDGRRETLRASSINVAVNAIDESSGQAFRRASLDGGELAVYVIERLRIGDLLRLALGVVRGKWQHQPNVVERRGKAVTIHSRRRVMRVMNDGEVLLLQPPLRYTITPRGLRVMAPDGAAP